MTPLNLEHEATGRVFLGRLYDMQKDVNIFRSGASTLESLW
jgi:hypothetical protein